MADGVNFAILRIKKHSNFGTIAGMSAHVHRTRFTRNANPAHQRLNKTYRGGDSWIDDVRNRLYIAQIDGLRRNGVLAIEHMLTTSPEFFDKSLPREVWNERANGWLAASRQWLDDTYGAQNVVSLTLHMDEKTPHLHALIVPIVSKSTGRFAGKNRLNAKHWIDGRQKMSEMQTSYANAVAHLGLVRGIEGSTARHETMKSLGAKAEKRLAEEKAKARIEIEAEIRAKMSKEIIDLKMNPAKVLMAQQWEEYQKLEQQKQDLINQISKLKAEAAALTPSPAEQNAFKPK